MNRIFLAGLVLITACTGKTEHTDAEAKKPQVREGVVIAPNGLVLREGPSSRSARRLLIPYGKTVTIISNSKITNRIDGLTAPWLYCTSGTQTGWVFGGFVRYQKAGEQGPRGLAIDRVPAVLYAVLGKTPAQAIRRFGQPVSLRQSAIDV
ncbi:MAG TPA: SH3 domain-containing protein, partial [Spirochaetota bacterium]|nr:SH3 domain-containing protein [Spirochaetota bacterium]